MGDSKGLTERELVDHANACKVAMAEAGRAYLVKHDLLDFGTVIFAAVIQSMHRRLEEAIANEKAKRN